MERAADVAAMPHTRDSGVDDQTESVTDPENIEAQPNFFIQTIPDKTNSTITIDNSGIGMIKHELVNNPETIAKVGMEAMSTGGRLLHY